MTTKSYDVLEQLMELAANAVPSIDDIASGTNISLRSEDKEMIKKVQEALEELYHKRTGKVILLDRSKTIRICVRDVYDRLMQQGFIAPDE